MKKVEALFISDCHLGSRGSNPHLILEMLKKWKPEKLFIVGDFIDGWLLKRRHYWLPEYTKIMKKLLQLPKKGTEVIWITGNHDDFMRAFTPLQLAPGIHVADEWEWNDYYISHGDLYDGVVALKWLAVAGSIGYEAAIWIDRLLKKLGSTRSLSKWAKDSVKSAVKFITRFEMQMAFQAKKRGCRGVVCGHIHRPEIKVIDDIEYINCGDWIENNSFVTFNRGKWHLHTIKEKRQKTNEI
jgi:UDP-2,3-diacylglucosamine pyrophosphatase LpxH